MADSSERARRHAEKLKAAGILPTAGAQELSVEKWEKLSAFFREQISP